MCRWAEMHCLKLFYTRLVFGNVNKKKKLPSCIRCWGAKTRFDLDALKAINIRKLFHSIYLSEWIESQSNANFRSLPPVIVNNNDLCVFGLETSFFCFFSVFFSLFSNCPSFFFSFSPSSSQRISLVFCFLSLSRFLCLSFNLACFKDRKQLYSTTDAPLSLMR